MFDVKIVKSETAESESNIVTPQINRRRALAKLGLTAAAIYVAPTLLALTPAGASEASGGDSAGDTGDDSGSTPEAASAPSAPEDDGGGDDLPVPPA